MPPAARRPPPPPAPRDAAGGAGEDAGAIEKGAGAIEKDAAGRGWALRRYGVGRPLALTAPRGRDGHELSAHPDTGEALEACAPPRPLPY